MTASSKTRRKSSKPYALQKPHGALTDRVQAVGPEHFGILAVDGAKFRSKFMLADFYGKVLIPPLFVSHNQADLKAFIHKVRFTMQQHHLKDLVVAIERTGTYHLPVQRAFRDAGFDTRLVHPFTTKQYRVPSDLSVKTDDIDLAAIFHATTQGYGLIEPVWPELYQSLQLLRRHRKDLVQKNANLQKQIREVLHRAMPGYEQLFTHLWEDHAARDLARHFTSAQAILQAGEIQLRKVLDERGRRVHSATIPKILAWAQQASLGHPLVDIHRRLLVELDDERLEKCRKIEALERDLAHLAMQTPYALLLAFPGINVVSVADLAGELGPIEFYLNPERITGRAGLMPSRYQSDKVDCANGSLVRRGHRRLRAVLMQTADCLATHNRHFKARIALWASHGKKDPRWVRVKLAKAFSRILFAVVAGRSLFPHPACQPRQYVLSKLMRFHLEHHTPPEQMRADLDALMRQLSPRQRAEEAQPLKDRLDVMTRRRGPHPIADAIALVLARMTVLQSEPEVPA